MKSAIILSVLACLAAGAAHAGNCPGEETNSPQLPAITRVELENPAVPNKPHPAMPSANIDRRSFVGASVRDGKLGLILTLAAPVAAGCQVALEITDLNTTLNQIIQGQGYTLTNVVFDRLDPLYRNGLIAVGNGSNVLRAQVPVRPRVTDARVFTPEVRLMTTRVGQNPTAALPFTFEVRPFEIVSFAPVRTQGGPGSRIEMFATLNEMPVEGAVSLTYKTSNTTAGLIDPVTNAVAPRAEVSTLVDEGELPPRDRTVFVAAARPLADSNSMLVPATTQVTVQLRASSSSGAVTSSARTASLTIDDVKVQKLAVLTPKVVVTPPPARDLPTLPGVTTKKTGN
ncbi:hypothetical protein ABAC460_16320 [Asticcacaulis sp. AC460]|uniref:hypothetical protein n=1 Tax=Asticcacaulis sp. AC460 TaxID=1282360 RepID=UPI0003C3E195|nr:hypothetical protein [Asticcacaulis sp. AC460]ESQ88226.1 hypothetical protein ABAC460_16320 [Asticcacaulis sp. AC460]